MSLNFYEYEADAINGDKIEMAQYEGKVVLVVNTASKCGFTPQYDGLQELYEKYKDKGLEILGFPCDQFGHQEPGNENAIQEFCKLNFGVTFPLHKKIDVNGANAHPLYVYLKKALPGRLGGRIKWNFTKFLLDRDGKPVKRFSPMKSPKELEEDILALL